MKGTCSDCGHEYEKKAPNQVRCSRCRKVKDEYFFSIRDLRIRFAILSKTDPKEAKRIMSEMEAKEGKEWTDAVIGDLFVKVRRNQYMFEKSNKGEKK